MVVTLDMSLILEGHMDKFTYLVKIDIFSVVNMYWLECGVQIKFSLIKLYSNQ